MENVTFWPWTVWLRVEFQARDGTGLPRPALTTPFVCNIGDLLMRWSNDIYVSTPAPG